MLLFVCSSKSTTRFVTIVRSEILAKMHYADTSVMVRRDVNRDVRRIVMM